MGCGVVCGAGVFSLEGTVEQKTNRRLDYTHIPHLERLFSIFYLYFTQKQITYEAISFTYKHVNFSCGNCHSSVKKANQL